MKAAPRSLGVPKGVVVANPRQSDGAAQAYLRRGRRYIPLGAPDAKDFSARLDRALLGPEPAAGTLNHLIWRYLQSPEFRRLAARTQDDYREQLARIRRAFGREPLAAFDDTFVTRRLAAGWSLQEVAFCTGHSFRNLACLERYADRGAIARALARRRLRSDEDAAIATKPRALLPEGP